METQTESKQPDAIQGVTTTPVLGAGHNGATSYADIPETKTYYPSLDEFASPLMYIQSIRDEAMKYGIIKIKPPPEWNPSFNLSSDDFKFETKIQPIHLIEKRVPGGSLSSFNLNQLRTQFLLNLRLFLNDDTISDVIIKTVKVFLYDMYSKVTLYGGYKKVNDANLWLNIAFELGICCALRKGQKMTTKLQIQLGLPIVKGCYELYLLDYEQCHYFPATVADLKEVPSTKFNKIATENPEVIASIPRCDGSGDHNVGNTCSVCGNEGKMTNAMTVILQCMQCGDRWHPHCHEPPIQIQELQTILQGQGGMWTCTSCTMQKTAKFGYQMSGHRYSLKEYKARAKQFKANFLKSIDRSEDGDNKMTPTEWENVFWSITDDGGRPLSVEYGSEIPSSPEMTGFPMKNGSESPTVNDPNQPICYEEHDFNLMNIKNAKGNILKHLGRDISGMTYPWIYVGMMFTAFGWHYEDHYAFSVNYNHIGDTKQWYGIPGLKANDAEAAIKDFTGGHFEQFDLVTLISPLLLKAKLCTLWMQIAITNLRKFRDSENATKVPFMLNVLS